MRVSSLVSRCLLGVVLSLYAALSFAQTSVINGIWKDNANAYWAFIQESNSSNISAVRLNVDLTSSQAFIGTLNSAQLTMSSLPSGAAKLSATLDSTGTSFSGQYAASSSSTPASLAANQLFAYQGSDYDGVWQNDAGHYLVYVTLQSGNSKIVVVVDLVLNGTESNAISIVYLGASSGTGFVGTELTASGGSNSKNTLRLSFNTTSTGSGSYVTAGTPSKVVAFSMTRVIAASSADIALSTN